MNAMDKLEVEYIRAAERLRAEVEIATGEATRLLEAFVHEHCSPVPEWKPLPDLVGILGQLSNAVTITRVYETENARLRAALKAALDAPSWGDQGDPEWAAQARRALEGNVLRAQERERCAKICDALAAEAWGCTEEQAAYEAAAKAIRAIEPDKTVPR